MSKRAILLTACLAFTGCVASLHATPLQVVASADGGVVVGAPAHGAVAQASVRVSFFQIPLDGAQDVVFLLDRSGSMGLDAPGVSGQQLGLNQTESVLTGVGIAIADAATGDHIPSKLEAAKAELWRTIQAMPDGTRIGIVFFDDAVRAFRPDLVALSPEARPAIQAFLRGIDAGGSTAAVPAMDLALQMGVRRLILLSDGLANAGGGSDELRERTQLAVAQHVRIDTVGLGIDQDAALLREMASRSGGTCVTR